ncbi:MAG: VOC family protein [Candidatus Binatia bacterium]
MSGIVHIALKVDELDKTSEFYEKVFAFSPVETSKVRDYTSQKSEKWTGNF